MRARRAGVAYDFRKEPVQDVAARLVVRRERQLHSEHWQRPLQVAQLLLGSSDIIWCGRGWLGRPIYGVSIALGGFSAENAAIDGGAKGSTGEQNLSDSICGDTRLVLGAISVGVMLVNQTWRRLLNFFTQRLPGLKSSDSVYRCLVSGARRPKSRLMRRFESVLAAQCV